ncbi:molybdate ABC transporter substrate-binding protein [Aidingimonas lacisalsi]|uniref:molybdate ABC transporter substrate-binding protein n=1 Tax=Aidingimonas lacisalsi TaxID=2604086 RepID=UPI0011D29276|nr:molybdate ABC transporter substrate-binding protein [Aidingimonas lacisalsi]
MIHWRCWLVTLVLMGWPLMVQADPLRVAAASNVQFALEEIAERFEAEEGASVRLTFGSSGNFRRQIAQGAPFEVFLSADEAYVAALYDQGLTRNEGTRYARGRLVWLQRSQAGLPQESSPLAAVEMAIERYADNGARQRIAMANPEHAPYGVAARQALEHAGVWRDMQPLKVLGENVAQATQFALSDDALGGLVAYSLAVSPALRERSEFVPIPEGWHDPLHQRMVLLDGAGDTARAFYEYLRGDEAQAIFERYGFGLPDPAESD